MAASHVPLANLLQVCVVVEDLQHTMDHYWKDTGIGPWQVYTFQPPALSNMKVHGKDVPYTMKSALTQVGDVQWEIVEPLEGPSIYKDFPTLVHYTASKFAVVGFTNALAKEVARDNITVNAICPGIVRTYMWAYLTDAWKEPGESVEDSWQRHLDTLIPQGRAQTTEDMGQMAVYFATADNVTGQAFSVDGGIGLH